MAWPQLQLTPLSPQTYSCYVYIGLNYYIATDYCYNTVDAGTQLVRLTLGSVHGEFYNQMNIKSTVI